MNVTALTNKINTLPDELQKQVADFVEFLILKSRLSPGEESSLTPDQQKELWRLWEEYEKKPDDVISIEMLQEQTREKYGL